MFLYSILIPSLFTQGVFAQTESRYGLDSLQQLRNPSVPVLVPDPISTFDDQQRILQSKRNEVQSEVAPESKAAAFGADGQMLNGIVDNTSSAPQTAAEANPDGIYRAERESDVPVKATSMRIAVRDITSDHVGAMEISLPLAPVPAIRAMAPGANGPASDPQR